MLMQMEHLIKNPRGEAVMEHSTTIDESKHHVGTKAVSKTETTCPIMQDEVAPLKQRVSELEKKLEEVSINGSSFDILNAHSCPQLFQGEVIH